MGMTFWLFLAVVFIILAMLIAAFRSAQRNGLQKPFSLSILALGLFILNWTLFLTDFYSQLPPKISNTVILPSWFLICLLGAIAAFKELKNNQIFAALNGSLAAITFVVGLLMLLISSM